MDRFGELILLLERVLRSARPEDMDEVEESVCAGAEGGGWVVRAREERRGDILNLDQNDCYDMLVEFLKLENKCISVGRALIHLWELLVAEVEVGGQPEGLGQRSPQ